MKRVFALAILTITTAASASGKQLPVARPVAALQECRTVAEAPTRLSCYDKAVDALSAATAANEVVIVERTDVRNARKGLFGFTLPGIGFLTGTSDSAEDRADEAQLETTITTSRSLGYGRWRFTVEGGASWETTDVNVGFNDPLPGRKVLLQEGSFGGYFATVGKGRRVAAKRIG